MELTTIERPAASKPSPAARPTDICDAERVERWLRALENALARKDRSALEDLFVQDAHWRDMFAFTWNLTPTAGAKEIAAQMLRQQPRVQASGFKIAAGHGGVRRARRTGEQVVETIYEFETAVGRCLGVLRFPVADQDKAWVISTSLCELKGFEEAVGPRRPSGAGSRVFGGESWAVRRAREQTYEDREPAVLIVGGGHNGLCIAAKLRLLGVDALVVERLPNVGDVWRRRYGALALHNEIVLNHLPYMPYPATWPTYLTKDMLGDWLEAYASALECNVWAGTNFVKGRWDEARGVWEARVQREDGSERVLYPRHIVFANGVIGEPRIPDAPGLGEFKGKVIHSHHFASSEGWKGKNVLVMGAGNTAHDLAQDLHEHGAHVKMIQRGSVTVFSVKAASLNHGVYYLEGLPIDDCDLISTCAAFPVALRGYQLNVQRMLEIDKDLLAGLKERGFKTDIGEDGGGHQMKIRKAHAGYYLNVGCSDLIVSGDVGLLHSDDIERFVADGALMKDGHVEKADLLLTATGYQDPLDVVRDLLGDETVAKIGPIWGLGPDGELRNMYKPTAQQGLWFTGGGFAQGRVWSHYIALQIKAREAGLVE